MKGNAAGRYELLRGSMAYLWEEIKAFNFTKAKLKALYRILTGYVRMKL